MRRIMLSDWLKTSSRLASADASWTGPTNGVRLLKEYSIVAQLTPDDLMDSAYVSFERLLKSILRFS